MVRRMTLEPSSPLDQEPRFPRARAGLPSVPRRGAAGAARADCERCAAEARVRILLGYVRRRPVLRWLCAACSDRIHERAIPATGGGFVARLRAAVGRLLGAGPSGAAVAFAR